MNTAKRIPKGFHAITPYLAVKDARAAIFPNLKLVPNA